MPNAERFDIVRFGIGGKLLRQGSNLGLVIQSHSCCRYTTKHGKTLGAGIEPAHSTPKVDRGDALPLSYPRVSVLPAGIEPAHPGLQPGALPTELGQR